MSGTDDMEQRLRAAQTLHGNLTSAMHEARAAAAASRDAAAAAGEEVAQLEREIRDLEAEGAQLRADIEGSRRALAEERARAAEEAAVVEEAIAAREAELAGKRSAYAERLRETQAATAAASDVAAQLRAQAAQRTAMAEEAATLRARLTEKRALHIHAELVSVTRAARQGNAAIAARLEESRTTRARYQEELKSLTSELQALRLQISAAISKKEHADRSAWGATPRRKGGGGGPPSRAGGGGGPPPPPTNARAAHPPTPRAPLSYPKCAHPAQSSRRALRAHHGAGRQRVAAGNNARHCRAYESFKGGLTSGGGGARAWRLKIQRQSAFILCNTHKKTAPSHPPSSLFFFAFT